MSSEYVKIEVDKIIENKQSFPFPLNMAMASAWILGNLKGINLKIFDVSNHSSLSDYYVLASASNTRQAKAMAEEITSNLNRNGQKLLSLEGKNDSDWILLDLGDIIIHIFLETVRDNYNLETLWENCPTIQIPNSYYFSGDAEQENSSEKSYF